MKKVMLLLGVWLFTASCEKTPLNSVEQQEEIDLSAVSSITNIQSEQLYIQIFDDVMSMSDKVNGLKSGMLGGKLDFTGTDVDNSFCMGGFGIKINKLTLPDTLHYNVVMSFNQNGSKGFDSRVRRGQMTTTYTNELTVPGAVSTTTFSNYSIDSVIMLGVYKIKNISTQGGNYKWELNLTGGELRYPNGDVVEWGCEQVIEQIEGTNTTQTTDDIFKITGKSVGMSIKNNQKTIFISEIIDPIIKKFSSAWLTKGKVKTTVKTSNNTFLNTILDLGNSVNDRLYTLIINGVTTTFKLN